MTEGRILQEHIEKALKEKLVTTQVIRFKDKEFFGDNKNHDIKFEIYDGFAYAPEEGYILTYPKLEFVNLCSEMKEAVRNFMGLNESETIGVVDVLQSYCTISAI